MNYVSAIFWLVFNFIKAAIASGFETARIILFKPKSANSGFCEMTYDNLDGYQLVILGMLITLTPGSTLIEVNRTQKTLFIHLLDLNSETQTKNQIQQDYIKYLLAWSRSKKEQE